MTSDELIAANDEDNTVDLLIRALHVTKDEVTRALIQAALLNEGRRIAATLPPEVFAAASDSPLSLKPGGQRSEVVEMRRRPTGREC